MYACDESWWQVYYDDAREKFRGEMWSQTVSWKTQLDGIRYIKSTSAEGLSTDSAIIHQGSNSGYQAINIAYHLGARRIILLGYDMKGRGNHWFGKHPKELSQNSNYDALVSHFETIEPAKYGIEIINCSRDTALHFPKMSLEESLCLSCPE